PAGGGLARGPGGPRRGASPPPPGGGRGPWGRPAPAGGTTLPAGLGGMGGAQPLAATMAGASILCVEVDRSRIERRLETRYLDEVAGTLDDALARVRGAAAEGRALSVGLLGNAASVFSELATREELFDLVTD